MKTLTLLTISAIALALSSTAYAGGHGGNPAVKARKAHMQLYAFNVGTLGAMAKGEVEYNAEAAMAAANNLASLSTLSQAGYWAPGTSVDELGDETTTLSKLWDADSTAGAIGGELAEAAAALAAVAGDGQAALGGAMGAVGKTCGTCHKAYRASRN